MTSGIWKLRSPVLRGGGEGRVNRTDEAIRHDSGTSLACILIS